MNFFEGQILAFDKPYRATSFNVVYGVRNALTAHLGGRKIKVGHAGTLDPLATGVLLVCTGHATKCTEELQRMSKEYVATLKLGATTASYDMEHPENAVFPTKQITRELVEKTLQRFTGEIRQTPPEFSACKIEGKRSYLLARRGKEIQLQPKTLHIAAIELLDYNMPLITIRVVCGKGTYIRALARDIGEALGSGAYLTALRRTRVGGFSVGDCLAPDDFPAWLESVDANPLGIEQAQNQLKNNLPL